MVRMLRSLGGLSPFRGPGGAPDAIPRLLTKHHSSETWTVLPKDPPGDLIASYRPCCGMTSYRGLQGEVIQRLGRHARS